MGFFPGRISQIVAQAATRVVREIGVEVLNRGCMPATHLPEEEWQRGYAIVQGLRRPSIFGYAMGFALSKSSGSRHIRHSSCN